MFEVKISGMVRHGVDERDVRLTTGGARTVDDIGGEKKTTLMGRISVCAVFLATRPHSLFTNFSFQDDVCPLIRKYSRFFPQVIKQSHSRTIPITL
jgi:hypothetical protein